MTARTDYSIYILLAVILMMTLWCGGILPLPMLLSTVILLAGAALTVFNNKDRIPLPATACAMGLVLTYMTLTLIPLPGRLDALTGRQRLEQNNRVRAVLNTASQLNIIKQQQPHFSITRNRSGTARAIVLALAVFAAAVITASLSPKVKRQCLHIIIAAGTVIAVTGFLHQWILPAPKTMWWFYKVEHGSPVGCFVSRTHFAGFIAMLAPAALAVCLIALQNGRLIKTITFLTCFLSLSFVTFLSHSRGALAALCAGCIAVLLVLFVKRGFKAILITMATGLIISIALHLTSDLMPVPEVQESATERIASLKTPLQTTSGQIRISLWKDGLKIWKDYPLAGTGADGFRTTHSIYRSRSDRLSYFYLENEYMQILVDGGLIGTLIFILFMLAITGTWHRNIIDGKAPLMIYGPVFGTCVTAAVHNTVDFPFHVPLYAVVLSALAGLTLTPHIHDKISGLSICRKTACLAFLLCAVSLFAVGSDRLERDDQDRMRNMQPDELADALIAAPSYWTAWNSFGFSCFMMKNRPAMVLGEECISIAAEYDPLNYNLWESLGYVRLNIRDDSGAAKAFARMKQLRNWKKGPRTEVAP